MSDNGQSAVNSMVSSLNSSINSAVSKLQAQATAASSANANVEDYQKTVRKSSNNTSMYATDIGILARATTRLTVASNLAADDTVDFLKFKVTSKGDASMGLIGDDGVRVQLMSKNGVVMADTNKDSGANYDSYLKLAQGKLTLDRGDYTLRVTRDKDVDKSEAKNYALQLQMGGYTQDYDTVLKQASKDDNPYQLSVGQQATIDAMSAGLSSLSEISYGQTGTQKLMGSFSLFV